jgi:hypothetical protein
VVPPWLGCSDNGSLGMPGWRAIREGHGSAEAPIHLEADSQELVKLWEAVTNQRSRIAPIIREIRELSMCFSAFNLMYTSRSYNRVAHTLAKVSGDNRLGEWQSTPACVVHLLAVDCNPDAS